MKKLITIAALFIVFNAHSQSIQFGPFATFPIWSASDSKIHGGTVGVDAGYYIQTTESNAPYVSMLGVDYVVVQTDVSTFNHLSLDKKLNLMNFNAVLTTGIGIRVLKTDNMLLSFVPEVGTSYSGKTFYTTNNQNTIVGSHLNFITGARLRALFYTDADRSEGVSISGEFLHQSNSGMVNPNAGINRTNLLFGIFLGDDIDQQQESKTPVSYNRKALNIELNMGYSGHTVTGYYQEKQSGLKYPDSVAVQSKSAGIPQASVVLTYNQPINQVFSIIAGVDMQYKFKPFSQNQFFDTYTGKYTASSKLNTGIVAGASVWLGKVVASGTYGYYIHSDQLNVNKYYTSFSIAYYLTRNVAIQIKSYPSNFGSLGVHIAL
jgi:hypothetical protein